MDNYLSYLLQTDHFIRDLLLYSDFEDILSFFEAYPEFAYLERDRDFLKTLSIVKELPYSNNIEQLVYFETFTIQDKLDYSYIYNDVNDFERILKLHKKYNDSLFADIDIKHEEELKTATTQRIILLVSMYSSINKEKVAEKALIDLENLKSTDANVNRRIEKDQLIDAYTEEYKLIMNQKIDDIEDFNKDERNIDEYDYPEFEEGYMGYEYY